MSNQDEEKQRLTQEQVGRAVEKLQVFYDSLPQDEKMVLEAVLSMAAGGEVTGHTGDLPAPIVLSGGQGTEFGFYYRQQTTIASTYSPNELFFVRNHSSRPL